MAATHFEPDNPIKRGSLPSDGHGGNGYSDRSTGQFVEGSEVGVQYWLEQGQVLASPRFQQLRSLDTILETLAAALGKGASAAIKGAWGFDLVCDATDEETVERLRQGKYCGGESCAPGQVPLAIMVRDLPTARRYGGVVQREAAALTQLGAPIVLLQAVKAAPSTVPLAGAVTKAMTQAPTTVGIMLPPKRLYQQLMDRVNFPLIVTSGKLAGEAPCTDNHQARSQLGAIADYFLISDQQVSHGADGSIVQVVDFPGQQPKQDYLQVVRRSRGYGARVIDLPPGFEATPPILAMGPTFDNTIALVRGGRALLSRHMGDLNTASALQTYQSALVHHCTLWNFNPHRVATEAHPDYHPTKLGREWQQDQRPTVSIQHHHAHLAACLIDNQIHLAAEPMLALVLDDFGYGCDDTLWGGELLWGNYQEMMRLGCLRPVPQLSGFASQRYPWMLPLSRALASKRSLTSSCGWLLGEVAALLDLPQSDDRHSRVVLENLAREVITDEALATLTQSIGQRVRLSGEPGGGQDNSMEQWTNQGEQIFSPASVAYPFPVLAIAPPAPPPSCEFPLCSASVDLPPSTPFLHLDPSPMWSALMMDLRHHCPPSVIAAKMYRGLGEGLTRWIAMAHQLAPFSSNNTVALTGSVFRSRLLLQLLVPQLQHQGLQVLVHRDVPTGDGGVSLGQAAIAAAQSLERQ
ncbi:MAG: Sua5/YciO/YrdC/YwlC family protein [Cyanophyceae cyanobacterium]